MPALPTYSAAQIAAIDDCAAAMLGVFARGHCARAEPSVLQPADVFLERSGEEIRRRTFILADGMGGEWCLRPDLTIPICRMHLERGAATPARYCYHGLAFRHQPAEPDRPTQFHQAGAELLGIEDAAAADAEILSLTIEALRAAGLAGFEVKIGDLGLFSALVDALDIPAPWRARLKRHFWRTGYFEALLARLSQASASGAQRLLAHLGSLPESDARPAFEGLMDMLGDAPARGRTREEIVDRLIEQAADAASLRLDPKIADVLAKFLAISGPADAALSEIRTRTKAAGVSLGPQLDAMERRLKTLTALGIDPQRIRFAARFGRNLEYYTGFVFELWARDPEGPVQIAGGGRYDTLLEMLGSPNPVAAIGCAIRTERVLAARRQAGGAP